jgi:hypothetical protein
MLLIKTKVLPGKYGLSLHTVVDIPKDAIIWQYNPIVDQEISLNYIQYLSEIEKEFVQKYAYNDGEKLILCSDDARYFNHSFEDYNCNDWVHPTFGSVTSAKRFIQAGEELTSNYEAFDKDFEKYKHLLT